VGGEEEEYSNASGGGKAGPHGRAAPGKAGRGASAARFRLSPARPGPQAVGWWFGRRAHRGLYHTALCCRGKCVEKGGPVAVRARACGAGAESLPRPACFEWRRAECRAFA
jgi:hypothetical protein